MKIFSSKFFIVLTLCLGMFGTVVFADSLPNIPYNVGSDWIVFYVSPTNFTVYDFNGSDKISFNGYGSLKFNRNVTRYKYNNGSWDEASYSSVDIDSYNCIYYSGVDFPELPSIYNVKNEKFSNLDFINSELPGEEEGEDVIIPGQPGDIEQLPGSDLDISDSIKNINKDLISNIKIILPVGIGVICLLLGVSFIPRIVYKFM